MFSSHHSAKRVIGAAVCAGALLLPLTASAGKPSEPANTGVVERFDTQGGHFISPQPIEIDGEIVPVLVIVGWESIDDVCAGPPAMNGVEQAVLSPSGNGTSVVHNEDAPVLLFDVTGIATEDEFFARCADGGVQPFAEGTVKQRPIIHNTGRSFSIKVKSQGEVTDVTGRSWKLQAFLHVQVVFDADEPETVREWIKLSPS